MCQMFDVYLSTRTEQQLRPERIGHLSYRKDGMAMDHGCGDWRSRRNVGVVNNAGVGALPSTRDE